MATNWYFKTLDGSERGPVSFQDLARLIHERALVEDSPVRPEYDNSWRSADDVVGLLAMAQRLGGPPAARSPDHIEQPLTQQVQEVTAVGVSTPEPETLLPTHSRSAWFDWLFAIIPASWLPDGGRGAPGPKVGSEGPFLTGEDGLQRDATADGPPTKKPRVRETARPSAHAAADAGPRWTTPPTAAKEGSEFDVNLILRDLSLNAAVSGDATSPSGSGTGVVADNSVVLADSEANSAGLGRAINDAVRQWDERHQPTADAPAEDTAPPRIPLLKRLNPVPLLERCALAVLKGPLQLLGWMIERGDRAVAQFSDRVGANAVSMGFRTVAAFVCGNLALLAIEAWSRHEALKFPGWQEKRGVKSFPLLGECSPAEYWFLAIDLAIAVAAVTFVMSRRVEFSARD